MQSQLFTCILVIVIFILIIILYYKFGRDDVIYVKSDIDGDLYLVRRLPDRQHAANMLARVKQNINTLIDRTSMANNKEHSKHVQQLRDKFKNCIIMESTENSIYTSYSVNKGEQIVFCLRSRHDNGKMHDINLIMYVALHEASHVACPEYGHTELFKKIFAYLTNEAVNLNLYSKIDFKNQNTEYCGLLITDSII